MTTTYKPSLTDRIFQSGGWRLSKLGEKLGWQWLIYNPMMFVHFHRKAVQSAPHISDALLEMFPAAQRMIDVGAGSGAFTAELRRRGRDAMACEYNSMGRAMARRQGVNSVPFDLSKEPPAVVPAPFDLAYCFEVAEHLPPQLGDRLVTFLAGLAPQVVFSAAYPGQGGVGHINEQPQEYWIERFVAAGAEYDAEASKLLRAKFAQHAVRAWWLARNALVFHFRNVRPPSVSEQPLGA